MATNESTHELQVSENELLHFLQQMKDTISELRQITSSGPRPDLSTHDLAKLMNREHFTVMEWARLGRINARKSSTKCGASYRWVVPFDEYLRLRREGLLPIRKP